LSYRNWRIYTSSKGEKKYSFKMCWSLRGAPISNKLHLKSKMKKVGGREQNSQGLKYHARIFLFIVRDDSFTASNLANVKLANNFRLQCYFSVK
jgi:hypothetical protein